jgi:hypothetical protein
MSWNNNAKDQILFESMLECLLFYTLNFSGSRPITGLLGIILLRLRQLLPRLDLPSAQSTTQQLMAMGSTFETTEDNALTRLWALATDVGAQLIRMTPETPYHTQDALNAYGLKDQRRNILFSSSHIALFTWKLLALPTTEPAERHIIAVLDVFKCIARPSGSNDSPDSHQFQYIEPNSLEAISLAAVVHQHPAVLAVLLDTSQGFHEDCKETLLRKRSLCYAIEPFDREYETDAEGGVTLNIDIYFSLLKERRAVIISPADAGLSLHTLLLAHDLPSTLVTLQQSMDINVESSLWGVDRDEECTKWVTALQHAFLAGNNTIIELLLNHPSLIVDQYDSVDMTPLCYAVYLGNHQAVKTLIQKGADVNMSAKCFRRDHGYLRWQEVEDWRPIHLAVVAEDPDLVQLLLDHGADVNSRAAGNSIFSERTTGTTALHLAALRRSGATATVLLKAGAKPDAKKISGLTPDLSFMSQVVPMKESTSKGDT